MPRRLRDIFLARPSARGPGTVLVQCLLILLWHALFLAICVAVHDLVMEDASRFWLAMRLVQSVRVPDGHLSLLGTLSEFPVTAYWSAVLVALEGAIAYLLFQVFVPRAPSSAGRFVRDWWRACLWGTVLAPPLAMLWALLPPHYLLDWTGPVPLLAGMVVGPTIVGRRERAPALRRARWRPVCPECGYSLRRAAGECCPECGVAFPTQRRVFRRWAIQRLTWDRSRRGTILVAYLRTVLTIVLRPCQAARGLVIPDRRGRAVRWALFHIGLAALIGLMAGSDMYFTRWLFMRFLPPSGVAREAVQLSDPPAMRVAVWALQSYGAWFIAAASMPLVGVVLSVFAPGRSRIARASAVKWSLYCSVVVLCVTAAWGGWVFARPPWSMQPSLVRFVFAKPAVGLSMWAPAVICAIWWARGISVNPYLRRRGFATFLLHSYLFVLTWLALTQLLFAPGPLVDLL